MNDTLLYKDTSYIVFMDTQQSVEVKLDHRVR